MGDDIGSGSVQQIVVSGHSFSNHRLQQKSKQTQPELILSPIKYLAYLNLNFIFIKKATNLSYYLFLVIPVNFGYQQIKAALTFSHKVLRNWPRIIVYSACLFHEYVFALITLREQQLFLKHIS